MIREGPGVAVRAGLAMDLEGEGTRNLSQSELKSDHNTCSLHSTAPFSKHSPVCIPDSSAGQ